MSYEFIAGGSVGPALWQAWIVERQERGPSSEQRRHKARAEVEMRSAGSQRQ